MNSTSTRNRMSWSARLLVGLMLLIAGAAAATWALARYPASARLLGVVPVSPPSAPQQIANVPPPVAQPALQSLPSPSDARIANLEARLARVENAAQHAEGSAGRADALVVAFAARRAIDRGVALGYLENLLADRFGAQHPQAVATIVTASREPVRLDELIADYQNLGPHLRRGGPQDSWWTNVRRELASMIQIHRADTPPTDPDARYRRALERLSAGEVDSALAETMRLPGASQAGPWIVKARRYIAAHRALDEVESSALLGGQTANR